MRNPSTCPILRQYDKYEAIIYNHGLIGASQSMSWILPKMKFKHNNGSAFVVEEYLKIDFSPFITTTLAQVISFNY